jgi:SAM-dependent methyltransferase
VELLNLALTELELEGKFDLGCAFTVIEHVTDDVSFLKELTMRVRRGGWVVVTVPAGENRWTTEDDLVGHVRRYSHGSLTAVMQSAGLAKNLQITVVGFPLMNITEFIRNKVIELRAEGSTISLPSERSKSSGVWATKWFNTFPRIFGLFINEVTLRPVYWIGKLFRSSPSGVLLLAIAQVD